MEDALYVNPDIVAQEVFGDWNNEQAVLKALKYCEVQRENCLKEHKSLIFETVLSTEEKVNFIKRAKELDFFIRLFVVGTENPTRNASRIAKRVMQGGHTVPIDKIISRYYKSITNCVIVSKFADRTYVYDNSAENEDAKLLFRFVDGRLFKQYTKNLPLWTVNSFYEI